MYNNLCPICNKVIGPYDCKDRTYTGYLYQGQYKGKIKRYFHLACLDSIKRGK